MKIVLLVLKSPIATNYGFYELFHKYTFGATNSHV